jgi:hypothetical protein
MLIDPITVAASSPTPALSFSVVDVGPYTSQRFDSPNVYGLKFSHKRPTTRSPETHYMQITQTLSVTDPVTGAVSPQTASASISMSIPPNGWTSATKVALLKALTDTLADSDVTPTNFVNYGI